MYYLRIKRMKKVKNKKKSYSVKRKDNLELSKELFITKDENIEKNIIILLKNNNNSSK